MSKKLKKSHVFIAKSILNRFSFRNPKNNEASIYYIDFNKKKINMSGTKKFNTSEGYFTDKNEKKLADYIESRIGKVISNLEDKYKKNRLNIHINEEEILILKKYIAYQIIRTDAIIEYIKDSMINENRFPYTTEQYEEQLKKRRFFSSKSIKELKNIFISKENENNTFFSVIQNLGIIVIFNKTNIPFLLNNNPSSINADSPNNFLMKYTISPKIAILLCNKNSLKKALNINDGVYITEYTDEDIIKSYNNLAYKIAEQYKPHILVGEYKELARILSDN